MFLETKQSYKGNKQFPKLILKHLLYLTNLLLHSFKHVTHIHYHAQDWNYPLLKCGFATPTGKISYLSGQFSPGHPPPTPGNSQLRQLLLRQLPQQGVVGFVLGGTVQVLIVHFPGWKLSEHNSLGGVGWGGQPGNYGTRRSNYHWW